MKYDVVIIGGGSAGIAALEGAKAAGAKSVCVVEADKRLGGECSYWTCVPTKAMLKAAKLYHEAKYTLGRYGVKATQVNYDFQTMLNRRDAVVNGMTGNGQRLIAFTRQLKAVVKFGSARFVNADTIEVKGEHIQAKAFVIATGSQERLPVLAGLEQVQIWSSRDVVSMKKLPGSVAIIGAGPVGAEFATLFGLLGVKTTLIDSGEQILPREDPEVAALAEISLRQRGVEVYTKTKPLSIKRDGRRLRLTFQVGRKPRRTITVERVIAAVGRRPRLDGLMLDQAGILVDAHGNLSVNTYLQTNQSHIFVAGDAHSSFQFTHVASHEGYIAGWNAAHRLTKKTLMAAHDRVIPRITFVDPEVASVGMSVVQARQAKKNFKLWRCPMTQLGRAAIDGNRVGMLKVITDIQSGHILGAHVIGERAGEVMHELALAIHAGIPFAQVQSMLHAYPSWSECIPAAQMN